MATRQTKRCSRAELLKAPLGLDSEANVLLWALEVAGEDDISCNNIKEKPRRHRRQIQVMRLRQCAKRFGIKNSAHNNKKRNPLLCKTRGLTKEKKRRNVGSNGPQACWYFNGSDRTRPELGGQCTALLIS